MKNLTLFFCFLLSLSSCKKADTDTYEPMAKKILGTWKLVSLYNQVTGVSQTYPNAMRSSTITFTDSAKCIFVLPCNGGNGQFLVDENGGFQLSNTTATSLFCSTSENNLEGDIENALENAYWLRLEGSSLQFSAPNAYHKLTYTKQ